MKIKPSSYIASDAVFAGLTIADLDEDMRHILSSTFNRIVGDLVACACHDSGGIRVVFCGRGFFVFIKRATWRRGPLIEAHRRRNRATRRQPPSITLLIPEWLLAPRGRCWRQFSICQVVPRDLWAAERGDTCIHVDMGGWHEQTGQPTPATRDVIMTNFVPLHFLSPRVPPAHNAAQTYVAHEIAGAGVPPADPRAAGSSGESAWVSQDGIEPFDLHTEGRTGGQRGAPPLDEWRFQFFPMAAIVPRPVSRQLMLQGPPEPDPAPRAARLPRGFMDWAGIRDTVTISLQRETAGVSPADWITLHNSMVEALTRAFAPLNLAAVHTAMMVLLAGIEPTHVYPGIDRREVIVRPLEDQPVTTIDERSVVWGSGDPMIVYRPEESNRITLPSGVSWNRADVLADILSPVRITWAPTELVPVGGGMPEAAYFCGECDRVHLFGVCPQKRDP